MDADKIGTMAQLIVHSHNHRSDRLGPKRRGSDNQTIAKRVAIWPHPGGAVVLPGPARLRGFTAAERECRRQRSVIVLHNTAEELAVNGLGLCRVHKERRVRRIRHRDVCRLLREPAEIRSSVNLN